MSTEKGQSQGQWRLISEVIKKGICVKCGACVGLCPYFSYYDGQVVVTDRCNAETWRCVQICPRIPYDKESLYGLIHGEPQGKDPIGPYLKVIAARSTDPEIRQRAQYGGVITALLVHALELGLIDSAVLTDKGNGLAPRGVLCGDREAIVRCSGSRYTASGALEQLNVALNQGKGKLAFVGLPCQMEALARMEASEPDGKERAEHVAFRLGLFCTWALDYRSLREYLKAKGISGKPKRFDIPPPPSEVFVLEMKGERKEYPLSELREMVQEGCKLCEDMTAEFADISVGTLEGEEGWNTVVVRTKRGMDLFERVLGNGALEQKQIPKANLEHLKDAANNKRLRAQQANEERDNG